MVRTYYPELSDAIQQVEEALPPVSVTDSRWRERCAEAGICYDANIAAYQAMREAIQSRTEAAVQELVEGNGQWG